MGDELLSEDDFCKYFCPRSAQDVRLWRREAHPHAQPTAQRHSLCISSLGNLICIVAVILAYHILFVPIKAPVMVVLLLKFDKRVTGVS